MQIEHGSVLAIVFQSYPKIFVQERCGVRDDVREKMNRQTLIRWVVFFFLLRLHGVDRSGVQNPKYQVY